MRISELYLCRCTAYLLPSLLIFLAFIAFGSLNMLYIALLNYWKISVATLDWKLVFFVRALDPLRKYTFASHAILLRAHIHFYVSPSV